MFPSAFALTMEGWRTVRERFGFHLLATFLCFLPTWIYSFVVSGRRMDDMVRMIPSVLEGDSQTILRTSQLMQQRAWMDWLSMPLIALSLSMLTLITVKGAVDQHRGTKPSLAATARAAIRALPWLLLLDVPAAILAYVGMACCCLPGIAFMLAYVVYLAYLPILLVEERLDLFRAIPRSAALARGNAGAQLGLFGIYVGVMLVMSLLVLLVSVGVGLMLAPAGGSDAASTSATVQAILIAYFRISQVFGLFLWIPWLVYQHARVAGYVHMARAASVPAVVEVFR